MRAFVVVAGAALLALSAGCKSSSESGFELAIQVPSAPTSSTLMCPDQGSQPVSTTGADTLRLTVFRESSTAQGELEFVCDRVVAIEPPGPNAKPLAIYAPIGATETARIYAEAWKSGAPQTDAGVPRDAGQTDALRNDAAASDAVASDSAPTDAAASDAHDAALQTDAAPTDGPKDALQADAAPPPDGAPKTDAGTGADSGTGTDGGTPAAVQLIASGQVRQVDLRSLDPRTLVLDQPRAFSCAIGVASVPRAFHTATVLPDGRVALIGGLSTGSSTSAEIRSSSLYGTASVEIYNPETQTFVRAVDQSQDTAQVRAFHSAYLLTSDATHASILLVGGLTSADGRESTSLADVNGLDVLDIAPAADAKAADAEIVDIDLATNTVTRSKPSPTPLPRFMHGATEDPPAPLASTYPLVVGGATAGKGKSARPTPQTTFEFLDTTGAKPGTPLLADAPSLASGGRLGATVTDVGSLDTGGGAKPTWLVLGGNLWSTSANLAAEMAEYVTATVSSGTPQSATSNLVSLPNLAPTAFHTATPVRDADGKLAILVAGGFIIQQSPTVVTEMAAIDPAAPGSGTAILSLIEGPTQVTTLTPPAGFKAVGFHEAVRLPDNSVLVTGGSPYNGGTGYANECPWNDECRPVPDKCPGIRVQQNSRQCAVCQAIRYFHSKTPAQRTVATEGNLEIARFGHRATVLWDGRVLITGGITSRLASNACGAAGSDILMLLTSAEIYNPQLGSEDPISMAADPTSTADPPTPLPARTPGEGITDDCCTCPSTIDEAKKIAKRCSSKPKQCVWKVQ